MKRMMVAVLLLMIDIVLLTGCNNDKESIMVIPVGNSRQVLSIILNKYSTSILVGGTEQLTADIIPENAGNQNVTWDSSDDSVATVSPDGLVTAVDEGIADITVVTEDGDLEATCEVTVSAVPVAVADVMLNKDETTLVVGNSELLTADIDPNDATNQNVSWISTNESIATVTAGGLVTAIAPGTASITAITEDGLYTDSCVITVNDATIPAEVSSLTASTGDGQIALDWTDPTDADFDHIEITWAPGGTSTVAVPKGNQTYTVLGLSNGTEYTFTVVSVDLYGNKSTGSTVAETPYNIREGLVGEWLFSGNPNDTSGYGHNGTVTGAALSSDRFNNSNKSYYFDGIDDRIDLGTFFTLHTFSISLWVKNTRISTDYSDIIENNHDFTNRWCLQVQPNSTIYDFGGVYSSIQNNQWTHIVLIQNENSYSVYVNGTCVGTNNWVGDDDGNQNLVLGYWYGGTSRWYQGYIDDIRAYNRVLSNAEILALYHEDEWDGNKESYSADGINFKMAYVPGKTFKTGEDDIDTATVSNPYWIGETEVTYELWYAVHAWAIANGYSFANPGREGHDGIVVDPAGAAPTVARYEPVTTINWRDAMVWCNALTEWYNAMNGSSYTCTYYTDESYSVPVREVDNAASVCTEDGCQDKPFIMADVDGNTDMANCNSTGFRLLTSDELELAARYINDADSDGDILDSNEYYPWNYASGASSDISDPAATGLVAWYNANSSSTTHAVAGKDSNALGLYDMSGNVFEFCFGWAPGSYEVLRFARGGSWRDVPGWLQVGTLSTGDPEATDTNAGLRIGKNH